MSTRIKRCPCGMFASAPGKHQGGCAWRDGKRRPGRRRVPVATHEGGAGQQGIQDTLTVEEIHRRLEVRILADGERHKDEDELPDINYQPLEGSKGGYRSDPPIPERLVVNGLFVSPQSSMWHHLYYDSNGKIVIHPDRIKFYNKVIAKLLRGVPRSDDPTFTFMGGGPAAGKSSIIDGVHNAEKGSFVELNSDTIKTMMPEYKSLAGSDDEQHVVAAAAVCHEESSFIAAETQALALRNQQDVLLDGCAGGPPEKLMKKVNAIRAKGYGVRATYVTAPTSTAVARSIRRAFRTGRYVPLDVVAKSHTEISQTLPIAMQNGTFDSVTLWDTCPDEGTEARRVATATRDNAAVRVLSGNGWEKFLVKGEGDPQAQEIIDFYNAHVDLPGGKQKILDFLDGLNLPGY